jgi:regulator of replication initiation timing
LTNRNALIENNAYMKSISIFIALSLIVLGCFSCGKEVKGLKEEIRLLKEENNFLKAENIGLKKELEKLYKKLDENTNYEEKGEIKLKPEPKEAAKPKEIMNIDQGVKKKSR